MKMQSEEDTDEQIQELKTITRLQGEPSAGVTAATPALGSGAPRAGLSISINIRTVPGKRASGCLTAHPPKLNWEKGSKGPAKKGTGVGDRSWEGLQGDP